MVYLLYLSSGSYDDYQEVILGVFSEGSKALAAKIAAVSTIENLKEETFKDTGWKYYYDPEDWELGELSAEDSTDWFNFCDKKCKVGEINRIWIEEKELNEFNFNLELL